MMVIVEVVKFVAFLEFFHHILHQRHGSIEILSHIRRSILALTGIYKNISCSS